MVNRYRGRGNVSQTNYGLAAGFAILGRRQIALLLGSSPGPGSSLRPEIDILGARDLRHYRRTTQPYNQCRSVTR